MVRKLKGASELCIHFEKKKYSTKCSLMSATTISDAFSDEVAMSEREERAKKRVNTRKMRKLNPNYFHEEL